VWGYLKSAVYKSACVNVVHEPRGVRNSVRNDGWGVNRLVVTGGVCREASEYREDFIRLVGGA